MTLYTLIKFIHVISISMMLGATLCNGLLHYSAMKSGAVGHISVTLKNIMQINRLIMAPSFVLLISSGLLMVQQINLPFSALWIWLSLVITLILVAEFLWGYRIEKSLENVAEDSLTKGHKTIQARYWQLIKVAAPIGGSATLFSLIIVYLMVVKPV